jgi:hypothetical protein
MGGHAYWYFMPYQPDINSALKTLQQQEFEAGRYNPVNPFPFDPDLNKRCKSSEDHLVNYSSIEEALEASGECGTRSILDMCNGVSEKPDICTVSPYPMKYLLKFFGSDKPSLQTVEAVVFEERYPESDDDSEVDEEDPEYGYIYDWFEVINRGECKYIIIYEEAQPSEIYFCGCSFD